MIWVTISSLLAAWAIIVSTINHIETIHRSFQWISEDHALHLRADPVSERLAPLSHPLQKTMLLQQLHPRLDYSANSTTHPAFCRILYLDPASIPIDHGEEANCDFR